MPTETFLHLSREKREHFLKAAYAEFAAHSYAEASVSRIVRRLGIGLEGKMAVQPGAELVDYAQRVIAHAVHDLVLRGVAGTDEQQTQLLV